MKDELQIVYLAPKDLTPYEHNARKHSEHDLNVIEKSIRENGFNDPIGIWGENNYIVEGHGRQLAALSIGLDVVPCIRLDHLTDAQRREYALVHNKSAELSEWDFATLEAELAELEMDFDMSEFGFEDINTIGENEPEEEHKGSLARKYLVPPFSVIYANKPDWLQRKHAWVDIGLHSEIGRGGNLLTIQGAIQRQTSYGDVKQTKNKANAFSGGC